MTFRNFKLKDSDFEDFDEQKNESLFSCYFFFMSNMIKKS